MSISQNYLGLSTHLVIKFCFSLIFVLICFCFVFFLDFFVKRHGLFMTSHKRSLLEHSDELDVHKLSFRKSLQNTVLPYHCCGPTAACKYVYMCALFNECIEIILDFLQINLKDSTVQKSQNQLLRIKIHKGNVLCEPSKARRVRHLLVLLQILINLSIDVQFVLWYKLSK